MAGPGRARTGSYPRRAPGRIADAAQAGSDIANHPNANKPIGTGPFKFVEWQKGQYMRFDRYPDYRKPGRPYLNRIVARFIGDGGTRAAALETGEVQIGGFNSIPPLDVKRLQALPDIAVTAKGYEMQSPIVELDLNTRVKPFDNVKVRQAVAYAIDRKFIIDNVWFGFGKAATGPISSNFKANGLYTADVKSYNVANGVELANKLLDEAGYPKKADGTRFEITHDVTPYAGDGAAWRPPAGAAPSRHQGQPALRGRADLAAPRLHQLRLHDDEQLDPDAGRPGHRRAPALPLEDDQAGHGVRERDRLEFEGDRRVDGQGHRRDRPEASQRALSPVAERHRRRLPDHLRHGARFPDRLQQETAGLAGEPARPLLGVRSGLAGQVGATAGGSR
ncbi:MAG: hypothetical protein IPI03_00090 [Rubrivivax sp.]|nr:hypothetical protein [Rubrivivax sp.]